MAGIKYNLQKEIFDTLDERILSVCNVSKLFKKKKSSYLCIITTIKPRIIISICQVKNDKGVYKKKHTWNINEVKVVDGKNEAKDTHEFDLFLEKQYRWFAPNLHERQNFLTVLWKQINKHIISDKAVFKNLPKLWLLDSSIDKEMIVSNNVEADTENGDNDDADYEDFSALTDKEETDLTRLMSECDFAISNAELFIEQLGGNLRELDGANVQSVLASETQVMALMEQIGTAIDEAEKVEKRLDDYDRIFGHIRDTMEKMGEKNSMIEIANKNNIKLLQELETVVVQLDLPHVHQLALTEPDLTPKGLPAAIAAGKALQNAMNSDIDPALLRLTAVQDQRKRFEKWKAKFSQTISRHLNNLFIYLGNDSQQSHNSNELSLPTHVTVHKELTAYAELMHWLKVMDRKVYDNLSKIYTDSLRTVYDREIKKFFEQAKQQLSNKKFGSREDLNSSMTNKLKLQQTAKIVIPYGTLGVNKEAWAPGAEAAERQKYDSILEKVLADLEPIVLSEQLFCIAFFQLDVLSPTGKNTQTTLDGAGGLDSSMTARDDRDSTVILPQKKIDRQINEEVRRMMGELFNCLVEELKSFISSFDKLDSL